MGLTTDYTNRYLLFAGETLGATFTVGGWDDCRGSFEEVSYAIAAVGEKDDWAHVVDSVSRKVVARMTTSRPIRQAWSFT